MMWEYYSFKSSNLPVLGNGHEDEVKLNELGRNGWELIWIETSLPVTVSLLVFSTTKLHKERTYFFRRPLVEKVLWTILMWWIYYWILWVDCFSAVYADVFKQIHSLISGFFLLSFFGILIISFSPSVPKFSFF